MTSGPGSLREALDRAVCVAVSGRNTAVAFSGGLDSGIVAAMVKEHAEQATLYTVGTENSHDVREAETSAGELGMPWVRIPVCEDDIIEGLREMIAVTGTKDPVTLSFELPLFFVCKNCREHDVIAGQGADELFAGYSKYIGLGAEDLRMRMAADMRTLLDITLPHEKKVAEHFGKRIHYPFLDEAAVREAGMFDLGDIAPSDDPASRKRILREISDMLGYRGISGKEKKAAQYGSGVMTLIKKICRNKGVTYAELIRMLSDEVR